MVSKIRHWWCHSYYVTIHSFIGPLIRIWLLPPTGQPNPTPSYSMVALLSVVSGTWFSPLLHAALVQPYTRLSSDGFFGTHLSSISSTLSARIANPSSTGLGTRWHHVFCIDDGSKWWSGTAQFEWDHHHCCSLHHSEMDNTTTTMIGMSRVFNFTSHHHILIHVRLLSQWASQGPNWQRYWQNNPVSCLSDCQKFGSSACLGLVMVGLDAVCHGDSKTGLGSIIVPLDADLGNFVGHKFVCLVMWCDVMLLVVLIPQHYFLSRSDWYSLTYGRFALFGIDW